MNCRHSLRLSDVRPTKIDWLWPSRIAAGKLSLIDGDPDQGKSLLTLDLVARLTTARPWPDSPPVPAAVRSERGCVSAPCPQSVLLIATEDGLQDTIVPRLQA